MFFVSTCTCGASAAGFALCQGSLPRPTGTRRCAHVEWQARGCPLLCVFPPWGCGSLHGPSVGKQDRTSPAQFSEPLPLGTRCP